MRIVYMAHPLGAGQDRDRNIAKALAWLGHLASDGEIAPVASWISLAQVWPETQVNRAMGLLIDLELITRCDEVWLVGPTISPGMMAEAKHAFELDKPVYRILEMGGGRFRMWPKDLAA